MNNIVDMHEEFIGALKKRIPPKDLAQTIADILRIEKDSAYRRLNGRVSFSAREIGILATNLHISIDNLLYKNEDYLTLPFMLKKPMNVESMNVLRDVIDMGLDKVAALEGTPRETGNIYNSIPMEFYLYSPELTKFMLFKWGYNFIGDKDFRNYSTWQVPEWADGLLKRMIDIFHFDKVYFIWDDSIMSNISKEINTMQKLDIITAEEKDMLRNAFKDMLLRLEQALKGTLTPTIISSPDVEFYVSSMPIGFTSSYYMSGDSHFIEMMTNFSFAFLDRDPDSFYRLKEWLDSIKGISTLLSRSARYERRAYFEKQHRIIDFVLR